MPSLAALLPRAGMRGEVHAPDVGAVDVGVELRRRDVGMPEQLLHGTQVGSALKEVRGVAVSQGVGVEPLDARHAPVALHDRMDRLPREAPAAHVEEDRLRGAAPHELAASLPEIGRERRGGRPHDGHHALLSPLAVNPEERLVQDDGAQVEPTELARAQAAAIEGLEDGAVTQPRGRLGEGLIEQASGGLHRDHVRQARRLRGQRKVGRGKGGAELVGDHEAMEPLDR